MAVNVLIDIMQLFSLSDYLKNIEKFKEYRPYSLNISF
jgi:hypothetical protein